VAPAKFIGQDLQVKKLRAAAVALKLKLEEIETQPTTLVSAKSKHPRLTKS